MSASKGKRKQSPAAAPANPANPANPYSIWLWLIFFGGSLFLIPQCMDRYLAPRFLFTSAALLGAVFALGRQWYSQNTGRLQVFDVLLIAWYGLNIASVSWAFSWSEGIFYAQKVLILLGVYVVVRQAFARDEAAVRRTMLSMTIGLTLVVGVIILVQISLAVRQFGLDNQHLYDFASGVFGNKGLASNFLFFLLILNLWLRPDFRDKRLFGVSVLVLSALLIVLQTRAVYMALAASAVFYTVGRALLDRGFRIVFIKKILPAGVAALVVMAALIAWKGKGSSLTERLNPATYLESASARERRFVWYKTRELNKEHFWLGVGDGSWKIWFPSKNIEGAFRLQEKGVVITRAHNDYLEVQAELGIVGAVLFAGMFLLALYMAGVAARRTDDPRARHSLLVVAAGLLGYCVIQYFDFPRERIEQQAVLGLFFAVLAYYSREQWARWPEVPVVRTARILTAMLAAGLLFNLLIGWKRISGEIRTVATLEAQVHGRFPLMLENARAAQNPFYAYNDVVVPMKWYEGIAYYQQGNFDAAVDAFEAAYRLNPWAFQVLNNYGSALIQTKRYPEAVAVFENALAINPKYDEGKFNLAYAWYAQGDLTKARDWLDRVDTIPNPTTDDERARNRAVLKQKADFKKVLGE